MSWPSAGGVFSHPVQVERAVETEINTGPARRPGAAAAAAAVAGSDSTIPPLPAAAAAAGAAGAAGGGGEEEEEYDPLEAFMAEVNQEVAANKPNKPAGVADVQQCDDVADPATEYMEVGWGGIGYTGCDVQDARVGGVSGEGSQGAETLKLFLCSTGYTGFRVKHKILEVSCCFRCHWVQAEVWQARQACLICHPQPLQLRFVFILLCCMCM